MELQHVSLPNFSKKKSSHPIDLKGKKNVKKHKAFTFGETTSKPFIEKEPFLIKEQNSECTEEILDFFLPEEDFTSEENEEDLSYQDVTYPSPSFASSPNYPPSPPRLSFTRKDPSGTSLFHSFHHLESNCIRPPAPPPLRIREKEVTFVSNKRYACPFCLIHDWDEKSLVLHILDKHPRERAGICPICASSPFGNPKYVSKDLPGHMKLRHPPVDLQSLPPKSRPTVHLIRSPHSLQQPLSSLPTKDRGELMWDFILSLDSISLKPSETGQYCSCCKMILKPDHILAVLPCQHVFHSICLPEEDAPSCPLCEPKKKPRKKKFRKRSSKSTEEVLL